MLVAVLPEIAARFRALVIDRAVEFYEFHLPSGGVTYNARFETPEAREAALEVCLRELGKFAVGVLFRVSTMTIVCRP